MTYIKAALVITQTAAIIFVATLLACEKAAAQEASSTDKQVTLVVHGASYHGSTQDGYQFNQANPGAALKLQLNDDWAVQAGGYRNSYYKATAYAVAQYTPAHIGPVSVGVFAGLATGYSHVSTLKLGRASVVAGLYGQLDLGTITLGVRAIPKISPKTTGVVTLEVGYKF